jgi:SEL1 protein
MYENGIGVKRDWWLAKRSYDLAGDMGGKLPVMLSLAKLYVRRYAFPASRKRGWQLMR